MALSYDEFVTAVQGVTGAQIAANPNTLRSLVAWIQTAGVTKERLDRSKPLPKGVPLLGHEDFGTGFVGLFDAAGTLRRQFLLANGQLIEIQTETKRL